MGFVRLFLKLTAGFADPRGAMKRIKGTKLHGKSGVWGTL
jgi:hypothetical protein